MSSQGGTIRIAVVDAETAFVRVLVKRLESVGWEHRVLTTPPSVDELVASRLSALIFDLNARGAHGWDFLELVADAVPGLGLIVCSGQSTVAQRVRGLRLGADDWVPKPCHPEEVLARVEAVVRRRDRARGRLDARPTLAGELEIRPDQFQAFVGGVSVGLTRREFELLELLALGEGRVIEREEIYQRVWGYAMARGDRSVDVFVRKIRQKLTRRSAGWAYIHTHFGVGYRFEPLPEGEELLEARRAEPGGDQDEHRSGDGEAIPDEAPGDGRARLAPHRLR